MHILVYVTCSNEVEAKRLARLLVEQRLAACVNCFPVSSVYLWKGRVEEAEEWAMLCKTTEARFEELKEVVRKEHSYELPCLLKFKVEGEAQFLKWIEECTSSTSTQPP